MSPEQEGVVNARTMSAVSMQRGARVERDVLTVAGLAARLEHRLHLPNVDEDETRTGCAYAIEVGMPTVLCRPEHIRFAAEATAGTEVKVATALGFHEAGTPVTRSPQSYAKEATAYVQAGADQVGLLAGVDDASAQGLDEFISRVVAVRDAVTPSGAKVRVLIRTTAMPVADLRVACRELARAGVWLVQGGTFLGDRVGIGEIVEMREALGPDVLLKWTNPLRSVEAILVCIAEGVDRFSGDTPALLHAAKVASRYSPLIVPMKGVDY